MITTLATALLVINEVMAANVGTALSPATNFDSWIELYNPGDEAVNLSGLFLSDDAADLRRWQLPQGMGSVPPKGFKVVWLGSSDIKATQAPFKLDCDGGTIYLSDDSGELLCSETYPQAMSRTAWARTTDGGDEWGWTADATPGASNGGAVFAKERLKAPVVDKGSCLFDGTLKVSVSIPEGATLMYTTDGSVPTAPVVVDVTNPWKEYVRNGSCEGNDASCLISRDGDGNGDEERIVDGVGYDGSRGIRIHAIANPQDDWDTQFFVYTPDHIWRSGEKYRFRMKVRADKAAHISAQTHTTPHNYIYWTALDGGYDVTTEWQEIYYEGTITDEQTGVEHNWWTGQTTAKDMQTIAFNLNENQQENNFYFDDVSWELFTGDGSTADASRQSLDGQFTFTKTTNLRLRFFQDGFLPSVPVTRSYIKTSNKYSLPVVSIVGDKKYFTDPKMGIDCDGTNGKTGNGQSQPKNYNQDWDRPVNFSYLSPEGEMLFNQDVNICVSGGWTRSMRYRSFKLKSHKMFDQQNHLDYAFFQQKPYIRSKTLLVRNGGNDLWTHNARFMDAALETIILRSGIDLDAQAYQPVIEYVNGELRGVLNLREPNNDKFAYSNFGYDDEELDAFENFTMKNGDDSVLKRILWLGEHINDNGAYDELLTLLDIDEFTNYMAVELYIGNDDWPDNNIKAFRSRLDGRYRFVCFDLDYAFSLRGENKTDNPFTYFAKFKNIKLVNFFLNLLNHDGFRRRFIDTFCVVGGSVFEPTRAGAIVDELLAVVQPMNQLMQRTMSNPDGNNPERSASTIKTKLKDRNSRMATCLQSYAPMKLSGMKKQNIVLLSDTEGARLFVNGIAVPGSYFNGRLFQPARLRVEAPAGYRFAGWKKGSETISAAEEIALPEGNGIVVTAAFVPIGADELARLKVSPVRVNEVSAAGDIFVNEYFKRNDWVELYNITDKPVDVAGMYLSDNINKPLKWQISDGGTGASTVVPPHGHLVIWCDKLEPVSQLHASFKLGAEGGDVLLTAADESWTDRLTYPAMKGDESAGRCPDGAVRVFTMNVPTIGRANRTSSYAQEVEQPAAVVDGISDIMAKRQKEGEAPAFNLSGQQVNARSYKGIVVRNGRKQLMR